MPGVDRRDISLLEKGAYNESVDVLGKLGKAFGGAEFRLTRPKPR